ncbi:VOC family protein [Kitasatospora azatica]|uniref:VOC family protein n=1 Tax=Kitasatospora azatica TaxID=58347 RepID=UPI000A76176A|nr:VOC family protein [Kitasatospora azatica]
MAEQQQTQQEQQTQGEQQEQTEQSRPPQVWPSLRARDARGLITFLVEVFGFEETVVYGEGELVHHAQLDWPEGGGVMLGSVRETDEDRWPLKPGSFGAYVVTDEPDALHDRAKAAGAEIIIAPYTTDYGSRDFAALDPEGNRWYFGTYRGEPRKQ